MGGGNLNNPSTHNATWYHGRSYVATVASSSKIAAEDGQTTGTFLNKINKESSAGSNIAPSGGNNVVTSDSASTSAKEYGQTECTWKNLHILSRD